MSARLDDFGRSPAARKFLGVARLTSDVATKLGQTELAAFRWFGGAVAPGERRKKQPWTIKAAI